MAKERLWTIVWVALAVAVASSVITAVIIGNSAAGQANAYAKSGFDAIAKGCCNNSITYQDVLNNLSRCVVVNVGVPAQNGTVQTGDYVCSKFKKTCIGNFIGFDPNATVSGASGKISQPISCNDATNNYPTASWGRTTCC